MNNETKKYADEAYEIVKHAANEIGPRLPGGENERKFAKYMGEKLEEIGIKAIREPFAVSPRASIGGLPYIGYAGVIFSVLTFLAHFSSLNGLWFLVAGLSIALWFWIISSVFFYRPWLDKFFSRKVSQNTYGELLPEDGKYDYTIILSAHTDTSWNWKHSEATFYNKGSVMSGIIKVYLKVGFGAVCVVLLTALSIFMSMVVSGEFSWVQNFVYSEFYTKFYWITLFLPFVTAFGSGFLIMWCDPKEENASPGAMDNATGIALCYEITKYFKENPDKMPKNCRIIDFNCGSEEAGLKGAFAFTKQHSDDGMLDNVWNINIDSIADEDYFQAIVKDDWQGTRFDKDLEDMFRSTMEEQGIVSKVGLVNHNPVGGCDSTPMARAGAKTITFAAQNPILTYYYHTFRDTPDRFKPETLHKGFDVVLGVIEKIEKMQDEKGFPGRRK